MEKIIALIPARAGSKGVPHKNIKDLGGHPLLEWSIKACQKSKLIQRTLISTDSDDYANLCRGFGAEVPFLRPPAISGDRSTDYDFVVHALDWFAEHGGEPEYIVHIRPTTPFRSPLLIDQAIDKFQSFAQATALRSIHKMSESAYKTFEIGVEGQLKRVGCDSTELDIANNARQQFPETYSANGYVDVLKTSFIRKNKLLHGNWVYPFITPSVTEVDSDEDFKHLEYQLSRDANLLKQIFG